MELIGYLLLTINLLSPIIFVYFYQKLQNRISNLEFDNDDFRRRIFDSESNIMKLVLHIGDIFCRLDKSTLKQKESEIIKLVSEVSESQKLEINSKRTLFDDLWKIEPPVKK